MAHRVLDEVVAESYDAKPTAPKRGNRDGVDGNARFYGFEWVNLGNGKDPWPEAQLEAIERAAAALCRAHGWSAKSVIGHLEWQRGKVDPRGFAMPDLRARIARRLAGKPGAKPPTRPTYEIHVVNRDETWATIGELHEVSVDRLRRLNGPTLTVGRRLKY